MKHRVGNEIKLILFCAILGAIIGIVFWVFVFLITKGTWVLWDLVPEKLLKFSFYPVVICTVGGVVIGLFRKRFGDYPENMITVFGKIKRTGTYPYQKLAVIAVASILPLIFGASVGPEAGMVGIIAAMCCWLGDNLKFAGRRTRTYSKIGMAVSLSVMFRSPLFGLFDVEDGLETEEENPNFVPGEAQPMTRLTRIILYCVAAGAGFGAYFLMSHFLGRPGKGFPAFNKIDIDWLDAALFLLYVLSGIILGIFFELSEKAFEKIANKIPAVLKETLAGLILGVITVFLPVLRFSGEDQIGVLVDDFALYAPLAMIGIAFLKVIMTNMCIQMGLKGGHIFPLIFAAAALGYGVSLMIIPESGSHATFAAAVVTAATMGVSLKRPLAASVLLLLCFPLKSLIWIIPAAALAAFVGKHISEKINGKKETAQTSS